MERNRIEFRPNRFRGLMPDGDWHMRLATALALAKSLTASRELFDAIEGLELQLSKNDECVHTVTAVQVVPVGMEAVFLMNYIERYIDVEPSNLCLSENGCVELTITARGDRAGVQGMAASIMSHGLAGAKAAISISRIDL